MKSLIILLFLSMAIGEIQCFSHCNKRDVCACTFDNGQYMDMSSLARKDGLPRFLNLTDDDHTDTFSWNPCVPFSQGGCQNVAICQIRPMFPNEVYFSVGNQDTAQFIVDENGVLTLQYTADAVSEQGTKSVRTSIITLICDTKANNTLDVIGQQGLTSYFLFEFRSHIVCPQGTPTTTTTTASPLEKKVDDLQKLVIAFIVLVCVLVLLIVVILLKVTGKICKKSEYQSINE